MGCYLFFGRGHPHTGQAANLWLVPHLGHSVGGLPPEVFSPLQAALMRAEPRQPERRGSFPARSRRRRAKKEEKERKDI